MDEKIGGYAFLVGLLIALLMGLFVGFQGEAVAMQEPWVWMPLLLVLLGLLVGFLNIGDKEVTPFLIAAIALMGTASAAGALVKIPTLGLILYQMVHYIAVFAAPAALIVAILEFWKIASTPKGSTK